MFLMLGSLYSGTNGVSSLALKHRLLFFTPAPLLAACNLSSGTDIENLECMNDVVGIVPCTMDIRYSHGNYFCSIFMGKVHFANKQSVYIEIKCPGVR